MPTRTQKSQMTLMKCKFAVVNTYNSFSLLHQDQPAVRSVFSGFAEKAVDVGGLSQVENVLVKVQIFTLMFLNCFVHPHSCQQTWIAKIFYFELQASTLTPFYYFFSCVLYKPFAYAKITDNKIYVFEEESLLGHFWFAETWYSSPLCSTTYLKLHILPRRMKQPMANGDIQETEVESMLFTFIWFYTDTAVCESCPKQFLSYDHITY